MRAWILLCLPLIACDLGEIVGASGGTDHPCVGHRTDTLWVDDDDSVWVGCGTTTSGTGLYASGDLGESWAAVEGFDSFRSTHVHRASDGRLYIAGTDTNGTDRVRSLEGDAVTTVFASQSQTWNSFHAGSFARLASGLAVAESLTGADLAWRASDGDAWQDGYGWWTDDSSHQVLDMVVHGDTLVAVGSTIIEPPQVFVADTTAGFAMSPTVLAAFSGELWTVDSDGSGLVVGGVDQDADVGFVAWTSGDPADAIAWTTLEVSELAEGPTWVRGVCRRGDVLVAAAEFTVSGDGLLLVSRDGGDSWRDETPDDAPSLSQCVVHGDRLVITGAEGYFRVL
ncbi:MAG: hypothetical protein EP330_23800 [Deltaproteobacteria bacterium]|nr:MAG: hypothetical protein EP330_23800 [Deltaproteobacteria bacterium]